MALSSTEAEYIALTEILGKEILWLRPLLKELGFNLGTTPVYIDNTGAEKLAKNPNNHQRTKHIDIRYHFIRQAIEKKEVELHHVDTKENQADLLTKSTTVAIFQKLQPKLFNLKT